jgi:hypothetical protein
MAFGKHEGGDRAVGVCDHMTRIGHESPYDRCGSVRVVGLVDGSDEVEICTLHVSRLPRPCFVTGAARAVNEECFHSRYRKPLSG